MFSISSIWGTGIVLSVTLLLAWFLHPIVRNQFTNRIQRSWLPRIILVVGLSLGLFGLRLTLRPIIDKPAPPRQSEVKLEFKRYQQNRLDKTLSKRWRALALSDKSGDPDSGYNFDQGDYAWVVSYDSCHVTIKSLTTETDTSALIVGGCQQFRFRHKRSALLLSVPLEYPPIYNQRKDNVFIKRWSRKRAELPLKVTGWFGVGFVFIASLFTAPAIELELGGVRRQRRPKRKQGRAAVIRPDGSEEQLEVEEMNPKEVSQKHKSPGTDVNAVASQIATEIQQAYVSGDMQGAVERWHERMGDKAFCDFVTSKIENQKAITAYLKERVAFDEAKTKLALSHKIFTEKESRLDANIAENKARTVEAERKYMGSSEKTAAEKRMQELHQREQVRQVDIDHIDRKLRQLHDEVRYCQQQEEKYPEDAEYWESRQEAAKNDIKKWGLKRKSR